MAKHDKLYALLLENSHVCAPCYPCGLRKEGAEIHPPLWVWTMTNSSTLIAVFVGFCTITRQDHPHPT